MLPTFVLYLRIRPEKISWLKFILEGYDGLAVLSTFNAKAGLVRIWAPAEHAAELVSLLDSVSSQVTPYTVLARH